MNNLGKLYIVATPIGNLEDITLRALKILKEVDLILCEDTRVTKKLLDHFEIKKPLLSYHQHSKISKTEKIISFLEEGKDLALVSDAGTPGISDPGNELISHLIKLEKNVKIIPVPGPSALLSLLSVSGINVSKFLFLGFPPHKKGRKTFVEEIKESEYPVVVFESKHRVLKLLKEFDGNETNIIVGREITKMFEEIIRGNASHILKEFENSPEKTKGEFVLIFKK